MHRRKDIYGEDADDFRPKEWAGDGFKDLGYFTCLSMAVVDFVSGVSVISISHSTRQHPVLACLLTR